MRTKLILILTVILLLNLLGYAGSDKKKSAYQLHPRLTKGKSANQLFPRQAIRQTMNYQLVERGGSWDCLPFTMEDVNNAEYPQYFDWRELGGVTPIDIQPENGCGGCWVYAATAVFESLIKIKTGRDVDLSEEQISSCLPNGNHTGIAWQAFNFIQSNGVTTEEHIPCDYLFPVCDYDVNPDYYYLNDNWLLAMWDIPLSERVKIMKYAIIMIR